MAAPQASSRLELLQARFQQKQLQEKEQKLLQLYDQQQQRAYQVVQRGNASSNHATITQHTVTKTSSSSSSSHATSTSQGGKVRQMFDERRQTTVKGIDRSYPLEPLENKPRKQANGNGVQKNGNLTVSRQSVTVKRVARADVNSNLNGGKPVVSYHEEIARETFGPSARQDDDEFGIENHVAQYSNGNHRDETRIEEVVDQDTIERNRMMAKLHLMEYDETLKHRVKNDLESEEFPEDFMVDVPDKLPKQSVTKKLSQAEARLKRFKNANAKRGNNVTKSQTIALKKRTDPIFPAKFSPRECRVVKDGGARKVSDERWNEGRKNVGMAVPSNSERRPRSSREESEKSRAIDSNTGTSLKEKNSENSKFLREEMSATARGSSSESFENRVRRGEGSNLFDKEFESSKTARKLSPELSKSPKFFNEESENSCSIDSKTARKLSLSRSSRDENLMRFERFDSRTASRAERNETPTKFYCEENEKSVTTYAIDSKSRPSGSPDYMRNTESFVLKIEPKSRKAVIDSATKKSTNLRKSSSPEYSKSVKAESPDVLTREKGGGSSPRLFNRERRKSASFEHSRSTCKSPNLTEMDMNSSENRGRESVDFTRKRSNTSPQFFSSDRSATIMIVTPETITKTEIADRSKKERSFSGKTALNRKETDSKHFARTSVSRYLPEKTLRNEEEMKKRHSSRGSSPLSSKGKRTPDPKPRFHHEKTTNRIDGVSSSRDSSPRSQRTVNSREETPELFRYESGKSATTVNLERSSKATIDVRSKGKSMEQRETKSKTNDRESEHTLRSTKLIRDTMMNQNQVDYVSIKRGKVDERVEIQAVESSPKSCTSVEIQEITMPDRGYLKQSRDTCSKSGKEKTLADSGKSSKLSSRKKTVHDTLKQRGAKVNKGICEGKNIFKPREQTTPSPIQARKRRTEKYSRSPSDESMARNAKRKTSVVRATNRKNEGKTCSNQGEILKSMELVRRAMRGSSFHVETAVEEEQIDSSTIEESDGGVFSTNSALNYVRTDSVESALRRFDSIGTEAGSTRSVESTRRQTESYDGILDRSDLNLSRSPVESFVVSSARKTSRESLESGCREGVDFAEENGRKKLCKRKLFHETDPTFDETERSNLEWLVGSNGKKTREHSVKIRLEFDSSDETSRGATTDKGETGETSTGADRSLSVRRLRSIEDIRKSIEGESEPVIESGRSGRGTGRSEAARRTNIDDRAGSRGEGMFLPGRSGNVAARNKGMGDTSRSAVKCAMRFPRVVKSPSPETVKTAETSNRARRNVPPSPSKSPDTMPRRASTELKVQDTKSTKRGTPMKGAEPIGNRKAMTTTTTTTTTSTTSAASTRKSTDVVDGAILENGLHLRDQTAETKYDNDSPTMKKSDAFVIDFDEQPPKENDAPLPRKPFLRKQSTEKQITPTQSLRTPMSISSTSSGISTQNQTSVYRSKMASRAKTPISTTSYKGSTSNKNGGAAAGGAAATETLVPCKACGRRFAPDRVALHEQICIKTGQKKRKQFDTMMYRVKGTDIEPFVKKGLVKKQMEKSKKPEVKSNWRRKHEDFINAIRSAKQVQAHLAAGGKLSDLPPPPVSDNYDYIQCPHCGRKFNKAAADRHIPKCEHMLHNKPIHSRAPKPKR